MSVLEILKYPVRSLSEKSSDVIEIDAQIQKVISDMGETMFSALGVGLAAPQIGLNKRIIVYDISSEDSEEKEFSALINPIIVEASGSIISKLEGCLSVPDYHADIERFEKIKVEALDTEGKKIAFSAEGLLSIVFQHEIDHLDGILYIDRLSYLQRTMYKKKIKKRMNKN